LAVLKFVSLQFRKRRFDWYPTVLVTKAKLYIELHGINKFGCSQIDHAREILKLTYHKVQQDGELKKYILGTHTMDEHHWMTSHGCIFVVGCNPSR
jgi:hypothetical protein